MPRPKPIIEKTREQKVEYNRLRAVKYQNTHREEYRNYQRDYHREWALTSPKYQRYVIKGKLVRCERRIAKLLLEIAAFMELARVGSISKADEKQQIGLERKLEKKSELCRTLTADLQRVEVEIASQ